MRSSSLSPSPASAGSEVALTSSFRPNSPSTTARSATTCPAPARSEAEFQSSLGGLAVAIIGWGLGEGRASDLLGVKENGGDEAGGGLPNAASAAGKVRVPEDI